MQFEVPFSTVDSVSDPCALGNSMQIPNVNNIFLMNKVYSILLIVVHGS